MVSLQLGLDGPSMLEVNSLQVRHSPRDLLRRVGDAVQRLGNLPQRVKNKLRAIDARFAKGRRCTPWSATQWAAFSEENTRTEADDPSVSCAC